MRFRQEGDEDADPVVLSTEDELDPQDPDVVENQFAAALAQHQSNLLIQKHENPERKSESLKSFHFFPVCFSSN